MKLTSNTSITKLNQFTDIKISFPMAKKLATAVANYSGKTKIEDANVNDLLGYHPMRYEDRSNMLKIDELYSGLEASVELYVRVSGGYRVGKKRSRKAPPLYIFEITASDYERKQKPVVVWWFLSGKSAAHIVKYWEKRFSSGTRFVAYGAWEWDTRRNTFSLKLAKPDELEILPKDVPIRNVESDLEDKVANENLAKTNALENSEQAAIKEERSLEEDRGSDELAAVHVGRCVPIYRKFGDFQTKRLREIMYRVLRNCDSESFEDRIPAEIRRREGLIDYFQAVREIHFPPKGADLIKYSAFRSDAQVRLIFEEFFWTLLLLGFKRGDRQKEEKQVTIEISDNDKKAIKDLIPFELTGAQKRVLKEILVDMESGSPMNRLIQGDVGSGKTIVAFISIYFAARSGYQAVLMAPTEILAEQHFVNAQEFFDGTGLRISLLTGSTRAAEKRKVKSRLEAGEIDILIGTHAVIQDDVVFKKLGFVIIDEQHRFGVLQRAHLKETGLNPEILVMTATPIPRSLAMTVYGDLDVSLIDELPPGRTPIKTVVLGEDKRKGVYKGIKREIEAGRQVYVVYPLISESEKVDLRAATEMYMDLDQKIFPEYRVGLLHGKLKPKEKEAVMADFVSGNVQILVSTTVIEVGVDVPNATLMVIEHADRFGLSQLHQLRGRVGRGGGKSYCVLLTGDAKSEIARERLGIMEKSTDGFVIAEKDLELRGQGEILGTRQSGARGFKLANIVRDLPILNLAKKEVNSVLANSKSNAELAETFAMIRNDPRFDFLDFA